jgi:hypothetical protein
MTYDSWSSFRRPNQFANRPTKTSLDKVFFGRTSVKVARANKEFVVTSICQWLIYSVDI